MERFEPEPVARWDLRPDPAIRAAGHAGHPQSVARDGGPGHPRRGRGAVEHGTVGAGRAPPGSGHGHPVHRAHAGEPHPRRPRGRDAGTRGAQRRAPAAPAGRPGPRTGRRGRRRDGLQSLRLRRRRGRPGAPCHARRARRRRPGAPVTARSPCAGGRPVAPTRLRDRPRLRRSAPRRRRTGAARRPSWESTSAPRTPASRRDRRKADGARSKQGYRTIPSVVAYDRRVGCSSATPRGRRCS